MRTSRLRLLAPLLLSGMLGATTLEQLSLDDMIRLSTSVVRAKVVSSRADAIAADAYTHYRLQVSETWKGSAPAEVTVPGGVIRGQRQIVAGAPTLAVGEEYVLFLWTSRTGMTQVIGLSQGLFGVKVDAANTPVLV